MRKQPFFYFLLIAPILVTVLLFACNNETTPDNPEGRTDGTLTARVTLPDKPKMWLDMGTSLKREGHYAGIHAKLTEYTGVEEREFLTYDSLAFAKMIDHFKSLNYKWLDVIIANDATNKLTLLYQPTSAAGKLDYYTLPNNADTFDPTNSQYHLINSDAETMIKAYQKVPTLGRSKMTILKEGLDKKDSLNYKDKNPRKNPLRNTLKIGFDNTSIEEMMKEIDYQSEANNNKVSGIRVMFAMIGPKGLERGEFAEKYKNRLVIHFEFTKSTPTNKYEVFYIDTTHNAQYPSIGFGQRRSQEKSVEQLGLLFFGLDKGQLCPAHCPEEGG